jgi:hypothetical protein
VVQAILGVDPQGPSHRIQELLGVHYRVSRRRTRRDVARNVDPHRTRPGTIFQSHCTSVLHQ